MEGTDIATKLAATMETHSRTTTTPRGTADDSLRRNQALDHTNHTRCRLRKQLGSTMVNRKQISPL